MSAATVLADLEPADDTQAREIIARAYERHESLELVGGGSKRGLGRPTRAHRVLALHRLAGVLDYEPSELVLTARAATPIAEIQSLLEANGQMLAFEPPCLPGATLAGTIVCNAAGPRRLRAGAARDHFLGFSAINGRGEAWRAGGKVVKNVTGYDMCKLQAGAFGTLSVLTEISVRVVPKPETECTILLHALDDDQAVAAMTRAINTPHEVSAASHLPAKAARRSGLADGPITALRVEGHAPSVTFRASALQRLFDGASRLDAARSASLWSSVATVSPLLDLAARYLWRLCPTPSASPRVLERIRRSCPSAEFFHDWAGGLIWLSMAPAENGLHVRDAVQAFGGSATLAVAPEAIRQKFPVFDPLPTPLEALSARIKRSFDPLLILNPGRIEDGR